MGVGRFAHFQFFKEIGNSWLMVTERSLVKQKKSKALETLLRCETKFHDVDGLLLAQICTTCGKQSSDLATQ